VKTHYKNQHHHSSLGGPSVLVPGAGKVDTRVFLLPRADGTGPGFSVALAEGPVRFLQFLHSAPGPGKSVPGCFGCPVPRDPRPWRLSGP
jgi:hypothetical protein